MNWKKTIFVMLFFGFISIAVMGVILAAQGTIKGLVLSSVAMAMAALVVCDMENT